MKKFLAIALLIASAGAFPVATPAFADSSTNTLCGPDAPEGYKRPGGYCEQLDDKGSLFKSDSDCRYDVVSMKSLKMGETILVAENCYPIEAL